LAVGATSEIFNVHQGLLCKSAEFFKRAMKPEWMEQRSDPHTIDLSEDCKETVTHYLQWLYTGGTPIRSLQGQVLEETDMVKIETNVYMALARAYVFGEKVMDIDFKNTILPMFLDVATSDYLTPPPIAVVEVVYAGTTAGSAMRRLLTDMAGNRIFTDRHWASYLGGISHCSQDALLDVCQAMARRLRPMEDVRTLEWEYYLEEEVV
jgi:prefoldin beta subunit